ncbi:MAG: hypothetical protein QRY72_00240 [Candidatus Rhabdochlamydia sp.]
MTNRVHSGTEGTHSHPTSHAQTASPTTSSMTLRYEAAVPPSPTLLPVNNPWVKQLVTLFPEVPIDVLQGYAQQFQSTTLSMINSQIQKDLQRIRKAAKQLKEDLT